MELKAHDPDLILCTHADTWIPFIVRKVRRYGLEPTFSRTGTFDKEKSRTIANGSLCLYEDGERCVVAAEKKPVEPLQHPGMSGPDTTTSRSSGVRFLLISGRPIHEPIAWYGPIVMNTEEELDTAFEEYRNGTFIKHGKKQDH